MYLTHATGTPELLVSFAILQALSLPDLINLISVPDKCKLPLACLPHYEAVFRVEGKAFNPPHTRENTAVLEHKVCKE